jgi:hypothetical protein
MGASGLIINLHSTTDTVFIWQRGINYILKKLKIYFYIFLNYFDILISKIILFIYL